MQFKYFIGIDVSKNTLDLALVKEGKSISHLKIDNDLKEISKALNFLHKEFSLVINETLFCLEHTGIYSNIVLSFLGEKKAFIWVESALKIKQSNGLQRGKNDKIDSIRIASYAWRNRDMVKLYNPTRAQLTEIKALLKLRSRLVENKKQLKTPVQECKKFVSKNVYNLEKSLIKIPLKAINKAIAEVEVEIMKLIKEDSELSRLYDLITSIDGIGKIVAANMITCTNEFKDFSDPKKFACYSGVAPFEYSSGKSLKMKPRVSSMANKGIKCLLHLSALSVVRMKGEFKEYYTRKVAEGKNKMTVVNAVRNKLILRIFAVVKNNRKYEKIYTNSLA